MSTTGRAHDLAFDIVGETCDEAEKVEIPRATMLAALAEQATRKLGELTATPPDRHTPDGYHWEQEAIHTPSMTDEFATADNWVLVRTRGHGD